MKKITWYLNRLKAMNMGEICWRFQQKNLQKQERRKYYKENLPVAENMFFFSSFSFEKSRPAKSL